MPPGLIVYVPGMGKDAREFAALHKRLTEHPDFKDYAFFVHRRSITAGSQGSLAGRGDELADVVDEHWRELGRPAAIILIGHSIGGLLVRHAYLAGLADPREHAWARHVQRIVLLAAPNRGFNPRRLGVWKRWLLSVALAIPPLARRFVGTDAVVGAAYLTDLRLRWVRTVRHDDQARDVPVVQVLGHADKLVTFEDSVDIDSMPNSWTVGLAYADHRTVVHPSSQLDPDGEQFDRLVTAVTGEADPSPAERQPPSRRPSPHRRHVVFLLHGIRANVFGWVRKVGELIEQGHPHFHVEHPSYGYLPAFNFAMPFGHDRQLRVFSDWYTEQVCRDPDATLHFVGHSNGTYILGQSLARVPAMTFENVYLGGSVLPTNYPWSQRAGQVKNLVNVCGTRDVPVGLLCSALRGTRRRDLGTGGFAGFDNPPAGSVQWVSVKGGHGAGFTDERLTAVAEFVRTATVPPEIVLAPGTQPTKDQLKGWCRTTTSFLFGFTSRLLMITAGWLGLAALAGFGYLLIANLLAAAITVAGLVVLVTLLRAL